jgi:uncharacterized protein (DUF2062 family)
MGSSNRRAEPDAPDDDRRPGAMTRPLPSWTDRFRQSLPGREELVAHRWLRPVAGRLVDPRLWRLQHESVARGVAVGTFWAFVIPAAQVVVAAAHCTWWRANIPVAAAMTMVTNPLTISFWLWLAYQVGALVLGEPLAAAAPQGVGTNRMVVRIRLADPAWHGPVCSGRGRGWVPGRQAVLALACVGPAPHAPQALRAWS